MALCLKREPMPAIYRHTAAFYDRIDLDANVTTASIFVLSQNIWSPVLESATEIELIVREIIHRY
jgi:hypothetical protein